MAKAERKPGAGRPRKYPALLDEAIRIRLTPEQREVLERAAEREGRTVSEWIRIYALMFAGGVAAGVVAGVIDEVRKSKEGVA